MCHIVVLDTKDYGGTHAMDSTGVLLLMGVVVTTLFIYFIPAFVAYMKHHANRTAILILNIFLGWTFFGWVISLIWAFKVKEE